MRIGAGLVFVGLGAVAAACSGTTTTGVTPGGNPDASSADLDGATRGDGGAVTGPTGLPCDVDKVLAQHCRTCHSDPPQFGAPMALTTWDALTAPARSDPSKKVYELVSARIKSDQAPMPQPPNPRLTSQEIGIIDSWIAAGTPKSTTTCSNTTPDAGTQPLSCTPDQTLAPASAWTMPQNTLDEYVCYGVDVTAAQKRHIIAIAPVVDNPKIVHHLLLFQTDQAVSPTPAKCSSPGGGPGWRMMFGWAPGGKNIELPQEAGFPQEGTVHYAVQVHYNNANALVGEKDKSGFKYCTGAPRPNDADVMAFGNVQFRIPPNGARTTTCKMTYPSSYSPITLFAALPHMHQLGKEISTVKLGPNGSGTPVDIGTANPYDFQNQVFQEFKVNVGPNDVIQTKCRWQNTTNSEVRFGEGTGDEMCYSFTMYYPKITQTLYNWQAPALLMSRDCVVQ
jgi:mono/diheme cytochrome c family protein